MKGRQRLIALFLCAGVLITLIPAFIFQAKASEQWLWPLDQCYVVLSNFGYRDLDGNGSLEDTHKGIDIIREPQDSTRGLPVRAAKSGTIITSKTNCTHYDKKGDCGCNGGAGN